ncbi:hypothetical protein ACH4U6_35735 [Streptomyces netropsis]|uniref:hypothetical protein n=1 Tax=Streptomyces netropsis TaxID=55404 RepID=UPI0037AA0F74
MTDKPHRQPLVETYDRNRNLWEDLSKALAALDEAGEEVELDPGEEFIEDPALIGCSGRVYFSNGWHTEPN